MTLGARWQKRWCEAIRGMRSSSTTRSYNSSSSTWRRGLLAVKAHPAVTGHITRRSHCTARPLHSRRVSLVRESMQKTGGCHFLSHHEPRLGGIRSAAASTGKHSVGRCSSVLATHRRHASTCTTARLRRMVRATHARACMHAPTATHRTTQTQTSISNQRT